MSNKHLWEGDSIPNAISYGGVTRADSFVYRTSVFWGCAPADVVVGATNGSTSAGVLSRLATSLPLHLPKFVGIMVGANDLANSVPVNDFKDNLRACIALCKQYNVEKTLILTPSLERGSVALCQSYVPYERAAQDATAGEDVFFYNLRQKMIADMWTENNTTYLTRYADTIHLSIVGQTYVFSDLTRACFGEVFTTTPGKTQIEKIQDLAVALAEIELNGSTPARVATLTTARAALP